MIESSNAYIVYDVRTRRVGTGGGSRFERGRTPYAIALVNSPAVFEAVVFGGRDILMNPNELDPHFRVRR